MYATVLSFKRMLISGSESGAQRCGSTAFFGPRKLEIGQAGQFVNAFTVLHFINVPQQGEPDRGWYGLEDLKWGLTCFLVLVNDRNTGKRTSLPGLMKHREHWNRWDTCHCHYPSVTEMALCMPHATALCRYSMFFFLYCNYYSRITVSPRTPNCIELPRSHDVPSKRECGSTFYFQAAVLQPNALDVPSMIALVANSIVSFDLAHVVFGKWKNRV